MGKRIDLTGQRFGRLVVVSYAGLDKQNNALWSCACDCGNTKVAMSKSLRSGMTISCGCARKGINSTHRQSGTRLYQIWNGMHQRTKNPNVERYANYGGRGIKVCQEWERFEPFLDWAFANGYQDDLTIDRIDVNGDYTPENCRWVSAKQQSRNTRRNHRYTYRGQSKTMGEWAEQFKIKPYTLKYRLKSGWSIEKALETPVAEKTKHK